MNFQTFGGYQEDLWPQAFADTDVELAPASATPNPAKVGSASVRIEGVVKQHGATRVLHGIDLQIAPGEFFVLLGPSGSGKTTTLRILAGLESVSAGHVYIDGADVSGPGLVRRGIGVEIVQDVQLRKAVLVLRKVEQAAVTAFHLGEPVIGSLPFGSACARTGHDETRSSSCSHQVADKPPTIDR